MVARGSRSSGSAIACGFLAGPCLNWPKSAGSSPCPSSPLTPIAGSGRSVGRSGCGVQSGPRRERPGGRARRRLGRRAGPLGRLVGVAARLTSSCWCRRTEVVVLEIVVRFAPDLVGRRVPGWAAGHRSISTHRRESDRRRLDPLDRVHAVNRPVEGSDLADPGALGAGDEVGLGEVDAVGLVHLDRPQQ